MTNKKRMTRAELEAYRARWRRINEFQIQEIRQMPLGLKLQQAEWLFALAKELKLRHALNDPEISAVRARWVKLKQIYEQTQRPRRSAPHTRRRTATH
jgi:hypothetical protein